ncbi:MAG TPA: hypothetical protein VE033_18540 [Acetobacteraceae bacterium]|jgi:hypothetical protein|nr:hypothetical protein [Acetobacteraceae bacterium]
MNTHTATAASPRREIPWSVHTEAYAHKRRCRQLPPPTNAEVQAMIASFLAKGGTVTKVATAFAVPTATACQPA